jgi:hypothetical protein
MLGSFVSPQNDPPSPVSSQRIRSSAGRPRRHDDAARALRGFRGRPGPSAPQRSGSAVRRLRLGRRPNHVAIDRFPIEARDELIPVVVEIDRSGASRIAGNEGPFSDRRCSADHDRIATLRIERDCHGSHPHGSHYRRLTHTSRAAGGATTARGRAQIPGLAPGGSWKADPGPPTRPRGTHRRHAPPHPQPTPKPGRQHRSTFATPTPAWL